MIGNAKDLFSEISRLMDRVLRVMTSARYAQAISFVIVFVLLLMRTSPRLEYPELWAEDGTDFLLSAMRDNWATLWTQFGGYLHTFGRIVSLAAVKLFPFAWIPHVFVMATLIYTAYTFSIFTRREYRWLIASDRARMMASIVLVFCYGFSEVAGTINNSHWTSFLLVGILGLRSPLVKLKWFDGVMLSIAALSEVNVLMFVPLYAFRFFWMWRRCGFRRSTIQRLCETLILAAGVAAHFYARKFDVDSPPLDISYERLSVSLFYAQRVAFGTEVLNPVLGISFTRSFLNASISILYIGRFLVSMLVLLGLIKLKFGRSASIILFALAGWAFLTAAWLGRVETHGLLKDWLWAEHWWTFRYAFPLSVLGILFWLVLASRYTYLYLVLALWMIAVFSYSPYFFVAKRNRQKMWKNSYSELERSYKTGCPKEITIETEIPGWVIHYVSPMQRDCSRL